MKGKKIIIAALAAFWLAGCAENSAVEENPASAASSSSAASVVEEIAASSSAESKPAESSSASSAESKPEESSVESSSTTSETEEKPAASSSATSTVEKPEEKPVESSSSTTVESKPVEKPASSTSSTSSKPVETSSAPSTSTKPVHTHIYYDGTCICGKVDPNYVAPHNCKTDGHIWKNSDTKTTTEEVEIKETHLVSACGYDFDLAAEYLGETCNDFTPYLGTNAFGEGSSKVKTTGTKTITTFYHECTECGYTETYDTKEEVIPGETWEFVNRPRDDFYPVVWYDINNIPAEILEGREKEKAFEEDVWASF